MKLLVHIALLITFLPAISYAQDHSEHNEHETKMAEGVEALSHDLRYLLSEEMKALEKGMMSIIPAIVSGKWHEIETTAGKMKASYILKQKLTKNQMKELHSKLPNAFIEKDQRFHYLSGMLEHAANKQKPELINFYFSEMTKSCMGCHSKFATHKFPDLSSNKKKDDHSH